MTKIIGYPLGWIMYLIYLIVKNYGLAIAIFTVIIKLIMMPLTVKQQKSTAAMQALNPKLEKLKKQYANNPQKLQEKQMELYNEEGVNPMASCLPMILQLLFLYGVFDVVYRPLTHILRVDSDTLAQAKEIMLSIEEYSSNTYASARPEIYIIKAIEKYPELFTSMSDFAAKVSEFNIKLFGVIDLGEIPKSVLSSDTVWTVGTIGLLLIPILSGGIQLIMTIHTMSKQKINPDKSSSMAGMNTMFYIMPLFSAYIAFSYPAGIGFYWIMSSLVSLIQNLYLHKKYTPEYVAELIKKDKEKKKNKKKSAWMEKYNEMMKEQMEKQNAASNSSSNSNSSNNNITMSKSKAAYDDDIDDADNDGKNLSKSQIKEYERRIIAEARRRQAEKYGDEYIEEDTQKK